jgi:hypothetical protein
MRLSPVLYWHWQWGMFHLSGLAYSALIQVSLCLVCPWAWLQTGPFVCKSRCLACALPKRDVIPRIMLLFYGTQLRICDAFLSTFLDIFPAYRYQAPADSSICSSSVMPVCGCDMPSNELETLDIWGEHDLLRERGRLTPRTIAHGASPLQAVRLTEPQLAQLHVMLMGLSPAYEQLWQEFCLTVSDAMLVAAHKQPRTYNGNLPPCSVNYMRKELWHQWAVMYRPEQACWARYWGNASDFQAVAGVHWGPVIFEAGTWAMADPTVFGPPPQPVNEESLPGVMRTPSQLLFAHVQQVIQLKLPFSLNSSAPASEWHAVLDVHWHRSPMGAAFDADLQAPLIAVNHEPLSGSHARCPYVPTQHLLPLGFTVRPYSVDTSSSGRGSSAAVLVALRRSWQALSVIGSQPPWPRLMHYVRPT